MNKRLPLLLSLLGMILLAASLAYWILQIYQPPQRPLAAAPHTGLPDPAVDAAAMLFGGQPAVSTATNYQLTGVVSAGYDSVAIIVAEGSPPKALKVGHELTPGVKLAEVHPRYVMLLDAGVMKRIDLAADTKAAAPMGGMPANNMQPGTQLPAQPPGMTTVTPPGAPPATTPAPSWNPNQAVNAPANGGQDPAAAPEPPMSPGAVQAPPSEPPPANPNSAPPQQPRTTGSPVSQNPTTQ